MITAKDVIDNLDKLLELDDNHVDRWLTDVFILKALSTKAFALSFPEGGISNYWAKHGKVYSREYFIQNLRKRNFTVTLKFDDRPCGGCYFNISCKE